MRRLIRLATLVVAAGFLLGASNCSKNNDSDAPQFVTTLQVENTSGQVVGAFAQGDSVNLVLTIRSRSATAQILYFNSSEFANFAVVNAGTATVVWACDSDASTVTTPTCTTTGTLTTASTTGGGFVQIDFAPFQTRTITYTWTGLDNNGAQVPTVPTNPGTSTVGQYEVLGGFTVFNTTGPGTAVDNGSSMAQGGPTAKQLFPTVYISTLVPFSIQ